LAGACAHTFAKGSAFQSRLAINIALVRITERARELVLRLASVLWRLRRATSIETAIFKSVTAEPGKVEHGHSRPTLVEAAELSDQNQLHLLATRQSDAAAGNELSFDAKRDIADGFLRLAALPTFALDRLSRYEHLLWRQARQIMFTLESLRRRKREKSQPVNLSIVVSAARARRHLRRVQMTTREINVERADQHHQFQRP
jgi:hypothetical protein